MAWYDKFYLTINVLLPDVDQDEKDDPDHIDEVPEQAHRSDAHFTFVIISRTERSSQHQAHQQDAGDHMQAVKAGEQIEHASEHPAAEAEGEFGPLHVLPVN